MSPAWLVVRYPTSRAPSFWRRRSSSGAGPMGVNIDGAFHCSRAAVKLMQSTPEDSNPAIVNVASMATIFHSGGNFGYGTAKAGLVHFTTSAVEDLYNLGIRVNCCSPGTTNTPILDNAFEGQNRGRKHQDASVAGFQGHGAVEHCPG
ncbi:hypothetical protein Z517_08125 [Fonsecaea pedrosoi CBS 271.37]|uniref:Uncharacterized protein n=1 Tax=Fonsecaea pedrosoi CBS 271.37 TaxID=1442368 RepID=A0A0D2GI44_9EURO|nr:uncharacterized protein Z517_08125 [Fonsecaea pedrosoi CBS 271.37]KIW78290.1 hypothetical protein Z517_08125 [Fonsecaea pedrosoi CBS 271.37]